MKRKALSQRGPPAVRGNSDLQIAALHDRAIVKMAVLDVVHGVAQNSLRVSLAENSFIDSGLRSSGNHQIRTFKVRRGKLLRPPFHFSLRDPLPDGWRHLRRDNANARLISIMTRNLPLHAGSA